MKRFAVVLMLAMVGCTGSSGYWITYAPKRGVADEGAHRRAVLALTDMGKTVETNDPASGIVVTTWERGEGMGSSGNRFRYRVSIDGGRYDVVALCEMDTGGGWADACEPGKRPRYVVETVDKIAAALQ